MNYLLLFLYAAAAINLWPRIYRMIARAMGDPHFQHYDKVDRWFTIFFATLMACGWPAVGIAEILYYSFRWFDPKTIVGRFEK